MLRGIPPILSPELMAVLMRMGHGDDLVLADGNFPAEAVGRRVVRADGHGVVPLLEAVLRFFPLDTFVEHPARVMRPVDPHAPEPAIWSDFRRAMAASESRPVPLLPVERFEFYELARSAYAVVATGETAVYANLILKKGVVAPG
uniref:Fucose isomerase n=1 Tax=Schlesneria paludicola TaxID=360056 RepID=A0A7C4LPU0_9PLAN